jgi:hypothetical protein
VEVQLKCLILGNTAHRILIGLTLLQIAHMGRIEETGRMRIGGP